MTQSPPPATQQPAMTQQQIADFVKISTKYWEAIRRNLSKIPAGQRSLFSDAVIRTAIHEAIAFHKSHVAGLKVQQTSIDPFKVLSWIAFSLAEKTRDVTDKDGRYHPFPIAVATALMAETITQAFPNNPIPTDVLIEIKDMAVHDKAYPQAAIGRNGFYMIFSVLQKTL